VAASKRWRRQVHIAQTAGFERTEDERIGPITDPAAHGGELEARQLGFSKRGVERERHTGGAVDQRAVEVEEDRGDLHQGLSASASAACA
jgi:hypothetical protein